MKMDIDQFFVGEDGSLVLADDCGNMTYCDIKRFNVVVESEEQKMTLEESIKHAEEAADICEFEASKYDMTDAYESYIARQECKCAEDSRQLAEWLKELKQLREQTRWIPVSERLPEDGKHVLICNSYGEIMISYYHIAMEGTYFDETGWYDDEGDALYFDPIAWKPLPERYKVESEE